MEFRNRFRRIVQRHFPFVVDAPEKDARLFFAFQNRLHGGRGDVEHIPPGVRVEIANLLPGVRFPGIADRALQRPVVLAFRRVVNGVGGPDVEEEKSFSGSLRLVGAGLAVLELIAAVRRFAEVQPRERQQPEPVIAERAEREKSFRRNQFRRKLRAVSVGLFERIERKRRRSRRQRSQC
ncbi:hypothetical protein SDC9_143423 [bioreactor metagenome]|uniref:Uncharacterized protein n=1 Tax=bioreactor metagenome TaxID=1076179 RepID=A0A645E419_9ZZZZ